MWKKINCVVEEMTKSEVSEMGGQFIHFFLEKVEKCEVGEVLWEVVNILVEV